MSARTPIRIALLLAMVAPLSLAFAADEKDPGPAALTDSKVNDVWSIQGRRQDELVFGKGPGKEPVVEFNSLAFRGREVSVEIETDSNHIIIINDAGEVDLRLEPSKKYRFKFDGDADKPKLRLGNKELHLQSPEWGRIINDNRIHSFRVMILDATEVLIKVGVRNGDIPLRSPEPEDEKKD